MKYFASFISVDEKIKQNDWALKPDNSIVRVNEAAAKHLANDWKKLKLYIVSNEGIKKGDKICVELYEDCSPNRYHAIVGILTKDYIQDDPICIIDGNTIILTDKDGCDNSRIYKIIGEVSKDAIWVKEGDVFEENELKFIYGIPIRVTTRAHEHKDHYLCHYIPIDEDMKTEFATKFVEENYGGDYNLYWDEEPTFIHHIEIYNSSCKHFH